MNDVALLKLLAIGAPLSLLFAGSALLFFKDKSLCSLLQLIGSACLMVAVLTHVAEAFHLLPAMRWGLPDSPGHYLDLLSAGVGLILFPIGYFLNTLGSARRVQTRAVTPIP